MVFGQIVDFALVFEVVDLRTEMPDSNLVKKTGQMGYGSVRIYCSIFDSTTSYPAADGVVRIK